MRTNDDTQSAGGSEQTAVWERTRDDTAEAEFVDRHGHVNKITVGTILEYDGWQWALVTEFATDRDEPMLGFVLLDKVSDYVQQRLESANGCRQHYRAVKHLCGSEHEYWAPIDYITGDEVWNVVGPIHPDYRSVDTVSEQ